MQFGKTPSFVIVVLLALAIGLSNGFSFGADKPVLAEDFEKEELVGLGKRLVRDQELTVVKKQGVGGSRALKATYIGYKSGSERIVIRYALGQTGNSERGLEYSFNYDVKFDKDFQFVRGGKLLGLGPEKSVTGGKPMTLEGWSARIMFSKDGAAKSYLYTQDKTRKYGVSVSSKGPVFKKDHYHAVSIHVKLNNPAKESNGFARIYIDGKLIVDHQNVRFRGSDAKASLISHLLFETFHGGSNPSYAPKDNKGNYKTVYAYFDNLAVYRGKHVRMGPGK